MTTAVEPLGSVMLPSSQRLVSIDVFRGLTVAAMLLVNDPGDAAHVFAPLQHSTWHGWTPTDLVFPFFLFVVGITTHLSFAKRAGTTSGTDMRRAVCRRAAIIFALGLVLNAYPFFEKSAVAGPEWLPPFLGHIAARLASLRFTGVLQRIALTYLIASFIAWDASTRRIAAMISALLVGYWIIMTQLPVPGEGALGGALMDDPARNMAAWFDRSMLDWTRFGLGFHMWDRAVPFDPEGLLSTIPATATVLIGVLIGRLLTSVRPITERVTTMSAVGVLAMMAGAIWNWSFPINKPIWTSSYVLFTAGVACLTLGAIMWLVDIRKVSRGLSPFLVFGTNPILAYFGGELLASILRSSIKFRIDGRLVGTERSVVYALEAVGIDAFVASMLWALLYVGLWYLILIPLYKRRIFLRV